MTKVHQAMINIRSASHEIERALGNNFDRGDEYDGSYYDGMEQYMIIVSYEMDLRVYKLQRMMYSLQL